MHLRDTPWCSNSLRSQGLFAPQPRPGFGSREWRRLETEQYTPAPTEKVLEPTGDGSHPDGVMRLPVPTGQSVVSSLKLTRGPIQMGL